MACWWGGVPRSHLGSLWEHREEDGTQGPPGDSEGGQNPRPRGPCVPLPLTPVATVQRLPSWPQNMSQGWGQQKWRKGLTVAFCIMFAAMREFSLNFKQKCPPAARREGRQHATPVPLPGSADQSRQGGELGQRLQPRVPAVRGQMKLYIEWVFNSQC